MTARVFALASLALAFPLGCGGGRADPSFTEPIVEMPGGADHREVDRGPPRAFSRPKLVVIRADWCSFCRAAQPGIDTAYGAYQTRVDLVVLDVTDEATTEESARLASHEGVSRFFATYEGRTPTVGVFVGPEDGRLVHGALDDPSTLERELAFAVERFRDQRATLEPVGPPPP